MKSPRLRTFTIHHHPIWDYGRSDTNPDLDSWATLYQTYGISATFAGSIAGGANSSDLPYVRAVSWDPKMGNGTEEAPGGSLGYEGKAKMRLEQGAGAEETGASRRRVTRHAVPTATLDLLAKGQVSVSVAPERSVCDFVPSKRESISDPLP